jgi:predicted ATP-grasp superfamily ATP-dependent carboligase
MNNAFLIFSGYNQRAVIAFCREAKRLNIPFFIIAKSNDDTIFLTSFKENVVAIRSEKLLTLSDIDQCLCELTSKAPFSEFVILPSSEFLNRFFLEQRSYFKEKSISIPLVEESLYSLISDKYSFGKLCQKYNLTIPAELPISEPQIYPFVAKPRSYFSESLTKTLAPYLIFSEKDWNSFLSTENIGDFYFQEFITGSSFYLLFNFSSNGQCDAFSQENLIQQACGKSIILAKSATLHLEKIAHNYADMLIKEGFEGLIMIELKKNNGVYYMIEANPRLWGPSQLFVDAEVPIFENFIRNQGFNIVSNTTKAKESVYFWHGGMVEDMMLKHTLTYHDYTPKMLEDQIDQLFNKEIYLREDTKNIYFNELKVLC